jgi:hypothetical protein
MSLIMVQRYKGSGLEGFCELEDCHNKAWGIAFDGESGHQICQKHEEEMTASGELTNPRNIPPIKLPIPPLKKVENTRKKR